MNKLPTSSFATKTCTLANTYASYKYCFRNASKIKHHKSSANGPEKFFFFQQISQANTNTLLQTLKQRLFGINRQLCLLQLHHPSVLTQEQQTKVYRSKIAPGAKVFWKDENKKLPSVWMVESIDNHNVSIKQERTRGDIPSLKSGFQVVGIDRIIGGRIKDATIPLAMPERLLKERVKLLYPTHVNSLKFFCKNRNFSIFASEMIWRDEGDQTTVKLRIDPQQEDLTNPNQGELVTGVRSLMTIVVDGEPIPVFVHEKDAMTLAEGRKEFFQRLGLAVIIILSILLFFVLFANIKPIQPS